MTPLERTLTALSHREPDRVPYFPLPTMHGARELGLSIEEYFSRAENIIEGQTRLVARYGGDCLSPFFYSSAEIEAWGGTTIFLPDGPPQCGRPILERAAQIDHLHAPRIGDSASLEKMLKAIRGLKERCGDEYPVMGIVIAPTSLPVMQMGFAHYLDLIADDPERLEHLLELNTGFTIAWGKAQLAAGATALCYSDPLSSPSMLPRALSARLCLPIMRRCQQAFGAAMAVHMASGRVMPILEDLAESSLAGVGVSALEDLAELKARAAGRVALMGNLNAITMRHWSQQEAEREVKEAIRKAGRGGGFVLTDNHGEIPFQVPGEVLGFLRDAVARWGHYPLTWIDEEEEAAGRSA